MTRSLAMKCWWCWSELGILWKSPPLLESLSDARSWHRVNLRSHKKTEMLLGEDGL